MSDDKSRLVYFTDKTISSHEQAAEKFFPAGMRPSQWRGTVRFDRKRRGGKSVTVIEGLLLTQNEREVLLKQLKEIFGTGGTVRDNSLEIQGDHREAIMRVLRERGNRPKRSGG